MLLRRIILGSFYVSFIGCIIAGLIGHTSLSGWLFVATLASLAVLGWLYR